MIDYMPRPKGKEKYQGCLLDNSVHKIFSRYTAMYIERINMPHIKIKEIAKLNNHINITYPIKHLLCY